MKEILLIRGFSFLVEQFTFDAEMANFTPK